MREDKNETPEHKEYLAFIRNELEGEPYTDNICESIRHDILAYYYNDRLKNAAQKKWIKDKSEGNKIAEQFNLEEFLPLD
jgi:hypothetical protein